jgi:signal transduction histidine kinase
MQGPASSPASGEVPDAGWSTGLSALTTLCGGGAALLGALALAWHWTRAGGPQTGWFSVGATTAAGFVLAGAALLAARRERRWAAAGWFARIAALGAAALAAESLFHAATGSGASVEARLTASGSSLEGSAALALVGIAVFALCVHRARRLAEPLAVVVGLAAMWVLIGSAFHSAYQTSPHQGPLQVMMMRPYGAAGLLLLATGTVLSRRRHRLVAILSSDMTGGLVARRYLAGGLVTILAVSWLRLEGQRAGLYDAETGVALMATLMLAGLLVITWRTASLLDHIDGGRHRALEALRTSGAALQRTVEERTEELRARNTSLRAEIAVRERAEAELLAEREALTESNQELEQFAYVASHDLQEPLRMVGSYLQLLDRRYKDNLDETAQEFIEFAVDGASRMKQLINDLLMYSRVERRGGELISTDAEAALADVLANLKPAIAESGATIEHDPLPTVTVDPGQLRQLLQNLISNAIKFRGSEPARITLSAEQSGGEWVFAVSDNGIGLEQRFADRIFEVFQRLHGREEYPGTGIGLAICKKIVGRHGGRIWVESQPGEGACFRFTIRSGQGDQNEQQAAA